MRSRNNRPTRRKAARAPRGALFAELGRVTSSNRTRKYLDTVIHTLLRMPVGIIQAGFDNLARDPSFSYRMREKFAAASEEHGYRWRG